MRDLLGRDVKKKLDLHEHPQRGVYVQGLSTHKVSCILPPLLYSTSTVETNKKEMSLIYIVHLVRLILLMLLYVCISEHLCLFKATL